MKEMLILLRRSAYRQAKLSYYEKFSSQHCNYVLSRQRASDIRNC